LTTEERVTIYDAKYPYIRIHNEYSFDIWKPVMKVDNLVHISVHDILESVRGLLLMEKGNVTVKLYL
jgi:hypothetical protein